MKETKIGAALADLNKRFGDGSVMRLGDKPMEKMEVIPTGCLSLDRALGVGGFPRGRIIEVYGNESAGKSTVALQAVASAQKDGGIAAYIDSEFAFDPVYAANLGVDVDNLLISQPSCAEEAMEIAEALIRSEEVAIVIIDSVAAMIPQSEINGDVGDAQMGIMARMMSQVCRKLCSITAQTDTCLLFINQMRSKIGVVFGNPNTTTGGNALKFYASVRLEISRTGQLKNGEEVVGNRTKVKIVKNKCAPPFKTAEFDIMFGKGISKEGDVIDLALQQGIMVQKGAWIAYGENKWQGKENLREILSNDSNLYNELAEKILNG